MKFYLTASRDHELSLAKCYKLTVNGFHHEEIDHNY